MISLLLMLSLRRQSFRILGVTLDSQLTFEIHLREVMTRTARSLSVVLQAGKLFDCRSELKRSFNARFVQLGVLCPVWMSLAESHLSLLDSIFFGQCRKVE